MNDALLIDLGNTRLKWALASAPEQFQACAYDRKEANFSGFLAAIAELPKVAEIWLSSVAGTIGDQLIAELRLQSFSNIHVAQSIAMLAGVHNGYADPARLGVDRFLALLGARQLYPERDVLIAIAGTALTIDFLDRRGNHHGGVIAPGPSLMLQSVQQNTAKLSIDVPLDAARPDFATDTQTALALGAIRACCGVIAQQRALAQAATRNIALVLSGGAAPLLQAELQRMCGDPIMLQPALVLHGLATYRSAHNADIR